MTRGSRLATLAAFAAVVSGATACQPPLPRLALTVTTTAKGADTNVGDGICASSAAGDACTLQAALDEGNVAPYGADLTVPTGTYTIDYVTVTGDININHDSPVRIHVDGDLWTVNVRGRLELNGFDSDSASNGFRLEVFGTASVNRSFIAGGFNVKPGGLLFAETSVLGGRGSGAGSNVNITQGRLLARSSSLIIVLDWDVGLMSRTGADSFLTTTAIVKADLWLRGILIGTGGSGTCTGPPPTSFGYVHVEMTCPMVAGQGDTTGDADAAVDVTGDDYAQTLFLAPGSPLIDAIPLGDPACDTSSVDLYGNPRGVDGNGDGIGGCDIGAIEYQPAA